MTKRLKKIAPVQLGKMLAVIYGLASLIFLPFFMLLAAFASMAVGGGSMPAKLDFRLFVPWLYAPIVGFITGLIGAYIYNLVARWIGGIEVEVE